MESQCDYSMYFPAVPFPPREFLAGDSGAYRALPRRNHLYLGETVRFLLVLRCRNPKNPAIHPKTPPWAQLGSSLAALATVTTGEGSGATKARAQDQEEEEEEERPLFRECRALLTHSRGPKGCPGAGIPVEDPIVCTDEVIFPLTVSLDKLPPGTGKAKIVVTVWQRDTEPAELRQGTDMGTGTGTGTGMGTMTGTEMGTGTAMGTESVTVTGTGTETATVTVTGTGLGTMSGTQGTGTQGAVTMTVPQGTMTQGTGTMTQGTGTQGTVPQGTVSGGTMAEGTMAQETVTMTQGTVPGPPETVPQGTMPSGTVTMTQVTMTPGTVPQVTVPPSTVTMPQGTGTMTQGTVTEGTGTVTQGTGTVTQGTVTQGTVPPSTVTMTQGTGTVPQVTVPPSTVTMTQGTMTQGTVSGGYLRLLQGRAPAQLFRQHHGAFKAQVSTLLTVLPPPRVRCRQVTVSGKYLTVLKVSNGGSQEPLSLWDVRVLPNLNGSYLPVMPDGSVLLVDDVCHHSGEVPVGAFCRVPSLSPMSPGWPCPLRALEEQNFLFELQAPERPPRDGREGLEVPLVAVVRWSTPKLPSTDSIVTHYRLPSIRLERPRFLMTATCESPVVALRRFDVTYTLLNELQDFLAVRLVWTPEATSGKSRGSLDSVVCHTPLTNLGYSRKGSARTFRVPFLALRAGLFELSQHMKLKLQFTASVSNPPAEARPVHPSPSQSRPVSRRSSPSSPAVRELVAGLGRSQSFSHQQPTRSHLMRSGSVMERRAITPPVGSPVGRPLALPPGGDRTALALDKIAKRECKVLVVPPVQ